MKLITEKEQLIQSQYFVFKLRDMYKNNHALFEQLNDYIPYSIYINNRHTLDLIFANDNVLQRGDEMRELLEKGSEYLFKISCPVFLQKSLPKIKHFEKKNDQQDVLNYFQRMKIGGEMVIFNSNKIILDEDTFFNVPIFFQELGNIGKVFEMLFKPIKNDQEIWLRFQTLTKQEKNIMSMIAEGFSNKEIADQLFITENTVKTHRRNINKKLDTNRTADIVKISMVLELIEG